MLVLWYDSIEVDLIFVNDYVEIEFEILYDIQYWYVNKDFLMDQLINYLEVGF